MIINNSSYIINEEAFAFQYEFTNLEADIRLSSECYEITTESANKENFIIRLKNAVINAIKKFINFIKRLITHEKSTEKSTRQDIVTKSEKIKEAEKEAKSKSDKNNKEESKKSTPKPVETITKVKVNDNGSNFYVIDRKTIEEMFDKITKMKDEIDKSYEETYERLDKMSWGDNEIYNSSCVDDANKEMQKKITIKEDFLKEYDSKSIKIVSNGEAEIKDKDKINELRKDYDELYFKKRISEDFTSIYRFLQSKAEKILESVEIVSTGNEYLREHSFNAKVRITYANYIVQKYNEIMYIAMFLKSKVLYNYKALNKIYYALIKAY